MQLLQSVIETRGPVRFPAYAGERVYMHPFHKRAGLPTALSHWQPTIDAMLDGIETNGPVYLMVDQSPVRAGVTHRRAGVHVDGYWVAGVGHDGGHRTAPGMHSPHPKLSAARGEHGTRPPTHKSGSTVWSAATFNETEAIILASSLSAARGFVGEYVGPVGEMGDCAEVDVSGLDTLEMVAGRVYAGNVCCLHESLPVAADCLRTVVRLNVPGWTP